MTGLPRPAGWCLRACVIAIASASAIAPAQAQTVTQRGFVEPRAFLFPQEAPNDATRAVVDFLARDEVFAKPATWIQFAAGLDLRFDSHGQVEDDWDLDFSDRTLRRPRLSIRRLTATVTRRWLTLDLGKQFIRWGRTDIVTPTDRFAPRDFLDVVDNEFLGVTGARAVAQVGADSLDVVWVPRFTPSRIPLLDQRWAVLPSFSAPPALLSTAAVPLPGADVAARSIPVVDVTRGFPGGAQAGLRWNHPGTRVEYSLSFFNGYNTLPNIDSSVSAARPDGAAPHADVRLVYPAVRSYGGDIAVPTRWFTVKAESAYLTSSTPASDEYALYVIQLERQTGEWVFVMGYAGEVVTERRAPLTFAPDRGLTRALVGRASWTIDANRSVAFETAVKQDGHGVWGKTEYSQARGDHWRFTATASVIAGRSDDFLGQYRRNSHVLLATRYSF